MKVRISPRAEKQLKNLPKIDQLAVAKKIRQIRDGEKVSLPDERRGFLTQRGETPYRPDLIGTGTGVTKEERLQGFNHFYRVRIGDLRIVYQRKQKEIYIILIGQRKDIYQLVKRLFS